MTKNPRSLAIVAQLRAGTAQATAITVSDTDILATDLLDPRIDAMKSGLFLVSVEIADGADANETYVIDLIGRQANADPYVVLASVTVPRGASGAVLFAVSVPRFRKQLNLAITITGTTPTITFSAAAVATEGNLLPDFGTVIVA